MTDWKDSVRAATTGNITLIGLQTVDGVALAANDSVLVKDQSTASENGIYLASSGTWTRRTDVDSTGEIQPEMTVRVSEGTVGAHTEWYVVTQGSITLGLTAITFRRLAGQNLTVTATVDGGSASVGACIAVAQKGTGTTLATASAIVGAGGIAGLALTAGAASDPITVILEGPVDPILVSLGAGTACAVGLTSSGAPLRVTSPTCTTGLFFLGRCDASGALFVQPRVAAEYCVADFGLVGDGSTPNEGAFEGMVQAMLAAKGNAIYFSPGDYLFESYLGPMPQGMSLLGLGGTGDYEAPWNTAGAGSRLIFTGPGPGILFDQVGSQGNTVSGAVVRGLDIRGKLDTGNGASMVNTTIKSYKTSPKYVAATSPLITVSGTPLADYSWLVTILSPMTFKWSTDGGATWSGTETITSSFSATGTGVTVHFPSGSYATADQYLWFSLRNYNECGIEIIGDTDITIEQCRFGGFKYQISVDSAEQIWMRELAFESDYGHGYQDIATDLDSTLDGAFAIRIGSFKHAVGNAANGVFLSGCQFNNTRWGIYHHDGVNHVVRDCNFECSGGMAILLSPYCVTYEKCAGEAATVANLWNCSLGALGGITGLVIDGVFPTQKVPLLKMTNAVVQGLAVRGCVLGEMSSVWPIAVDGTLGGGSVKGFIGDHGNVFHPSKPALLDVLNIPQQQIWGTSINHSTNPQAALDVVMHDYDRPLYRARVQGFTYQEQSAPHSLYGSATEQFSQSFSGDTAAVGARSATSVAWAKVSASSSAQIGAITVPNSGSGVVIATLAARNATDDTKVAYWRARQFFKSNGGGTITLLGSATVEVADTSQDSGFASSVGGSPFTTSGSSIVASVTGHSSVTSSWNIGLELHFAAA
jgi:hypothetical protein